MHAPPRLPSLTRARARASHLPGPRPAMVADQLLEHGVALEEAVLDLAGCSALIREVHRQRASSARPELGAIHSKGLRTDLPLRPTRQVMSALVRTAHLLAPVLEAVLGPAPRLVELSSLNSPPGSADQPPHPDALASRDPTRARLVTVFIPLVDVPARRGPLEVWPGTHRSPPSSEVALRSRASRRVTARAGDAVLMDACTWHRGTANADAVARPVFYTTWMSAGRPPEGPTWSRHPALPASLLIRDITPTPTHGA